MLGSVSVKVSIHSTSVYFSFALRSSTMLLFSETGDLFNLCFLIHSIFLQLVALFLQIYVNPVGLILVAYATQPVKHARTGLKPRKLANHTALISLVYETKKRTSIFNIG